MLFIIFMKKDRTDNVKSLKKKQKNMRILFLKN